MVQQSVEADLLDSAEYRPFWISWYNGNIQAGKGDLVGINELMAYKDENQPSIEIISLATGNGILGEWKIVQAAGTGENS